jgi:hypothetical protein
MARRLTDDRFLAPPHIRLLSQKLVDVATGRCPRLLVQMPPRHGKSTTGSWWFPVWFFDRFPHERLILASYGADLAADWGRRVRNTLVEHAGSLSVRMADDSSAADRWDTTEGGGMITSGVGGSMTGRGAKVLLVDDPVKNADEANSGRQRDRVWKWWQSVALTRLEPNGAAVVMQTRWHEDDLTGRIIADEGERWETIRLPAIAESADRLGRSVGQALWPERYDAKALQSTRQSVGDYVWDSLYQQKPPSLTDNAVYLNYVDVEGGNRDSTVRLLDGIPLQMSVDFNRTPGMNAVLGQHLQADDTLTARHVLHAPHMTIEQMIEALATLIRERYGEFRWGVLELFGDATGRITQESDGRSRWTIIEALLHARSIPYRRRVPKRNPGVLDRVNAFNNVMKRADGSIGYRVHPDCELLIRDLKRVKWDGEDIDKSDPSLSHASDADGYRVHYLMPIRTAAPATSSGECRAVAI